MGTRSTTQILEGDRVVCTIYRQMDGYPTGHGADMLPLLQRQRVNGYNDDKAQYNGVDNFAAMLITMLMMSHAGQEAKTPKDLRCGGIYIADAEQHAEEFNDYQYTIKFLAESLDPPTITVTSWGKNPVGKANMTVEEFAEFVKTDDHSND